MSKIQLSIAVGQYDRTQALLDGQVAIDGVDPVFMSLSPEETFFRAFRGAEFDVAELSLSSYLVQTANNACAYVGLPVFLSRAFRHTAIYVRTDKILRPEDLRGARVGLPEYQLTANVWARALLADEHGIDAREIEWVRGGIDTPGRPEKIALKLPAGVRIVDAPAGDTLSALLARGDIAAFIGPRPPAGFGTHPQIDWLYRDPASAAADYHRRTGVFPIMHLLGLRKTVAAAHPWLPAALYKAFDQAKRLALQRLADPSAPKVSLPFVEEQVRAARALMGADYWAYGVDANRKTLETFARHHHAQGLSLRSVAVEEMFHPGTLQQTIV